MNAIDIRALRFAYPDGHLALDGIDLLHLTAYSLEVEPARTSVVEAARRVHDNGGRVSFDVSSVYTIERLGDEEFVRLLKQIAPDFISANQDEPVQAVDPGHRLPRDRQAPGQAVVQLRGVDLVPHAGHGGFEQLGVDAATVGAGDLQVEAPGELRVSSAENMLSRIQS